MFTMIGEKNCKVIVDNSINTILSKVTERLELKAVPHPTRTRCHRLTPRP